MKHFLISFLVFIVWAFFGLWIYSVLQSENSLAKTSITASENALNEKKYDSLPLYESKVDTDTITTKISTTDNSLAATTAKGFTATLKNGETLFSFKEGIQIKKDSKLITIPPSNANYLPFVKQYLEMNADKQVEIISLYSPSESFETPNHGYQRGNMLKNLMIKGGIPSERISVKSSIKDISFSPEGVADNGIQLQFKDYDPSAAVLDKEAIPENITVYPRYSGNQVLVNQRLKDLTTNVQQLMNLDPDLKLTVIGHTGNGGNANDNYDIALAHARQVRWYLVEKGGIDRNRIQAISEGEAKGIYSNNTERGRRLNQRIEIKFRK
ncbi:OmpA family protein [Jejudonia soesokkakensis]|uniref:OmpA family protein n=1 Tax=Jejudonia soesokkakensis TaxID=1323432 RepID=A0ABW2MTM5_9FLAO